MNVSLKWLKAPVTLGARVFSPPLLFPILRLFYMFLIVLWLRDAAGKHANKTRTTRVDGSSNLSWLRLTKSHLCVWSFDVRSTAVKRDRGVFRFI